MAVAVKDVRTEARSRFAVYSMLLFCLTALAVAAFGIGGAAPTPGMFAALLWVILFFAAMTGPARSFIKEEEAGTLELLRCVAQPGPLFAGKALYSLLLLWAAALVVCPLFCVLMNADPGNSALLAVVLGVACLPSAVMCTVVSALVSQARGRGMLFPALTFPVLAPAYLVAVRATEAAFRGASFVSQSRALIFLLAYAVAGYVLSWFLFEYVFED